MDENIMAALGFIALGLISGREQYSILDHTTGGGRMYSGHVDAGRVDVREVGGTTVLSGDLIRDRFILHDYGSGGYFELMLSGNHFHVRDTASGEILEGRVEDVEVMLYDYEKKVHHRYSFASL